MSRAPDRGPTPLGKRVSVTAPAPNQVTWTRQRFHATRLAPAPRQRSGSSAAVRERHTLNRPRFAVIGMCREMAFAPAGHEPRYRAAVQRW
jgi:hypothetical protein